MWRALSHHIMHILTHLLIVLPLLAPIWLLLALPHGARAADGTPAATNTQPSPPATQPIPAWFPKAPPLPAPAGNVLPVANVEELFAAVNRAKPTETVLLADGQYIFSRPLVFDRKNNITIRSASADPSKVVISGKGWDHPNKNEDLIHITQCDGITIADLSFADCRSYGIKVQAENAPSNINIYDCRFRDIGVRAIKGSTGKDPNVRAVKGSVRYCIFQNTKVPPADWLFDGDYITAIDMMSLQDWIFSDNVFRNINGRNGGGRAAIFIWVRSRNVTVERNLIVNCDRGIAFGNPGESTANLPGEVLAYVTDSVIRNNFIAGGADCGIELWHAQRIQVLNNSIWRTQQGWQRGIRIGTGTAQTDITNNLVHGEIQMDGGEATLRNNLAGRLDNYFVDPAAGDLSLTPAATGATGHGIPLPDVTHDIRSRPRARPNPPAIGAWESDSQKR